MKVLVERIKRTVCTPRYHVLCLLLAVLFGGSKHFASPDLSVFLLIAYGAGFYLLMLAVIIPVIDLIPEKFTLFGEAGKKNRFLLYFAAFFLLWLPFLIIKYPGAVHPDTWEMISYYEHGIINDKHSVLYCLFLNWFVHMGRDAGSADAGLFIFLILQHVCCCFCFAYAVSFLDRLGTRPVIKYSVAAITLFNPYIIGYVGVALKDIPYSAFALLLTILIAEFCFFPESFGKSFIKMIMLTATVMLVCFMRSNGIYVVVLTAAALIPLIRKDRKKAGFAVVMLAGVILFLISNMVILKTSGTIILENNYKEALSIPFQQTARYVRDNSDDITDEEREIIDRDLNIETLAERYNPRISDPVKNAYEGNKSGIPEYLGVWGKQLLRHPLCYVAATWEQNHSLMLPVKSASNTSFYKDYCTAYELDICYGGGGTVIEGLFTSPESLKDAKDTVIYFCEGILQVPVLSAFWNVACCTILLLVISYMALAKKRSDSLGYLMPLLSALLITIAGPVIYGHPRYMFPVILALPFVMIFEFKKGEKL